MEAVLRAGRDAGIDFVLNARTDALRPAPAGADRGRLAAGGDPARPGVPRGRRSGGLRAGRRRARGDRGTGRRPRPAELSVISVPGPRCRSRELQELGVARVSTGPFTQRVALTALQDAAGELVAGGVAPAPAPAR